MLRADRRAFGAFVCPNWGFCVSKLGLQVQAILDHQRRLDGTVNAGAFGNGWGVRAPTSTLFWDQGFRIFKATTPPPRAAEHDLHSAGADRVRIVC